MLDLREQVRGRARRPRRRRAGADRAHRLDDGRVQHRPRRASTSAGGRDRDTTDRSTSACSARVHASGARVVGRSTAGCADAILAAVTPRTRLLALSQVLWTTGRVLPVRELTRADGLPVLVDGAQSVGAIPVDAAGLDFYTVSGQKWLCGPDSTGALVVARPGAACASPARATSPSAHEPRRERSSRRRVRRASTPAGSRAPSLAGLLAALDVRPDWRLRRARPRWPRAAASCSRRYAEVVPGRRDARLLPRRRIRPESSRGWPRRASSCASSRDRARPRLVRLVDRRGRPGAAGRGPVRV